MIHLKNVAYCYPGRQTGSSWALDHIDLNVREGEFVFILGPSGSGKSTVTYVLNGLVPHFFGGHFEGSGQVCGQSIPETPPAVLTEQVALVLQNTDAYLFCSSVEAELLFSLERSITPRSLFPHVIDEVLSLLGIEPLRHRAPQDLSGGEKQLAALASALCLRPRLLVLDEPFAHLDTPNRQRVQQALEGVLRLGTSVIVAEHVVDDFAFRANRCLVMESGRVCFDGAPEKAHGQMMDVGILPRYAKPTQEPLHNGQQDLVELLDVSFYREKRPILDKVSLTLTAGERVAITGPNGSGKTTLVKILGGLLKPHDGLALWCGRPIHTMPPSQRAQYIGVSFQNPNDQFFKVRVEDEVWAGPKFLQKKGFPVDSTWLTYTLDLFGLTSLKDHSPYRLSEGEKKRVALASVLAMNPQVLVLDEPTAGQDGRFRQELSAWLRKLSSERHMAIVVVTHDADFAHATCQRRLVLQQGRLVEDDQCMHSARDNP
ncbi:ABC transporter ATP-binding protein [Desulfosoma caldarium]|uniref:Energy-coupling factor transport system ATP-binding protein n=1 Tax=Desulfosoma caldarium TaxID=610254 RepID=A0A3N1UHE8_9BACT|nr:ABC transporter ATP-binding protein [Desulfosoma caldarium]ROQ89533.1 energy-coupling factor transport system ATP-binding protein [Desulfosoma caldarium]